MYTAVIDIIIRLLFFSGLYKSKRPIWLVSDRASLAGDNGEALYRYMLDKPESKNAYFVFAVSKKSPDYERLSKIGDVVDIQSFKYKMLHLRSSMIISSAADDNVQNPFPRYRWPHLNDLYRYSFVFLQHGVVHNDLSDWLNRFYQNMSLVVTTTQEEYNAFTGEGYWYGDDKVILSGQARYDLLENDPKNILVVAPTWRKNLLPEKRGNFGGVRAYSSKFKDTDYFAFYNHLLHDTRLIEAMEEHSMTIEF